MKKKTTPKKYKSKKIDSEMKQPKSYEVTEEMELLPFLFSIFQNKSKNSVKSILSRGQVEVNHVSTTKHNTPLHKGDRVVIKTNQSFRRDTSLVGMKILHEDDSIIVIDKEAGLLSIVADNPHELTAHNQLMQYVKAEDPKNRIYVVHRLDKGTSGVMVFAKNEQVKKALQDNWKDEVKERTYTAVVEGAPSTTHTTISTWLTESKAFKMHSASYDNGGKKAITHYKVLKQGANHSLVELQLETGRKNQIRVHMETIGHPIVGDKKYGSRQNPLKRLGLHATTLTLVHPVTKETLRFKSPYPKSFNTLVKSK